MKILHIIDSAGLYGAEMVLLNLAEEQAKIGHHPVIASIREKDEFDMPLEEEASRRALDTVTFRMLDGPNFLGAWSILRYSWAGKFDIIHSHGYKGNILLGFVPRSIRKIPIICTVHGWTSTDRWSMIRLYERADSLSHKYLDAVVLVHKAMLNHPFFARKRISKVFVVNNGIPSHVPEDFERTSCIPVPIHEKILEFCSRSKTIGAIGRLSPEKGFDILLEAFHTMIAKGYDLNLLIVGDGPERRKLEEIIARRNMNDRVFLPGYVAQASCYLKHFSVFVISSLTEGLPITLLEAMRAGVPVVSTRVGGIEEVIGGGSAGILVDPRNSDKLAEGMCALICDDELADNLSRKAENRFINNYSSKIMAENYIHVYNDIV